MESTQEKYLIVNADDFGIDARINKGIVTSCLHGIVRSVSLVANGRAFEDAVSLLRDLPHVGVGVHVCLVAEKALLSRKEIPSLVNSVGDLAPSYAHFFLRLWSGQIDLGHVEAESEAQIRRILDQGIRVTHLDSHQYLHLVPGILRIFNRLCKRFGIRWIRYPGAFKGLGPGSLDGLAKILWLRFSGARQTFWLRSDGISTADNFYTAHSSGRLDQQMLEACLNHLRPGVSDLTCHPGYDPFDLRYAAWGYRWQGELASLCDPAVIRFVKSSGIRLGNYGF